ncbi:MAG: cyclophilin-like fold protein [Elusimicrobiota bacterium]|nr:cyclophilin-like fold protein [Endomicrobiia bacterium]MDW8165726.1 cyclophilin-like fold protein [Elusimicrobiota bacterium]
MKKIKIKFPSYNLEIICNFNNTTIADKIYEILPQESKVKVWGEEIYFELPLELNNESPTLDVEVGDVAWWPDGSCFCIFFGKTPISTTDKPKPYSEVTVVGKIESSKEIINNMKQIKTNSKVILEKYL